MNKTVHAAVLIIAVLSLFLGLSLGQLHEKHNIQETTTNQADISIIRISPNHCNMKARIKLEQIEAEMARENEHLEREKERLKREIKRVLKRSGKHKEHIILREEM